MTEFRVALGAMSLTVCTRLLGQSFQKANQNAYVLTSNKTNVVSCEEGGTVCAMSLPLAWHSCDDGCRCDVELLEVEYSD